MLESADAGIIVYYHGSQLDETHNKDRTVFIIRNNKDVEMSSQDIQKALDPNKISCPRCFHIYKRAQKLFKNIPSLAKKETRGICDHCAKLQQKYSTEHGQANRTQCKCKNVINRFLTSEKERDLASAMNAKTKPWQSESKLSKQSILESRKYHSDESLCKDLPCHKENFIEKPFSFVFPKVKDAELNHQISSSELIRALLEKDGRIIGTKQVERNKSGTLKDNDKNKSSRDSTPKTEKEVKEIKEAEKLQLHKGKEMKDMEKPKSQKEKESKDNETPKSQKEKDTKDDENKKSQNENKDLDKSKSQKEKDAKNVEKKKSEKENKDLDQSKPQKEKESKGVEKSKPEKETKADAKSEKESTKKNNEADDLLKQLLSKGDKAKAEAEKSRKEQELASQKAKLLAEQKLKELTIMPVAVKVKSPLAKIKASDRSDLEVESNIAFQDKKPDEGVHIIVGQKILKNATSLGTSKEQTEKLPLFFKSAFQEEVVSEHHKPGGGDPSKPAPKKPLKEVMAAENRQGVIRYALSDRTFIDKGWTKLPTEKVVRKMNVYRMRPAHPEFDWFEHNKNKREMLYDSGQKLAEFSDDGRGRWFYRSGKLALDYYNAEECNAQQRYVVYSNGEPDERGRSRPRTVLATFDYSGNGVVFDHNGKIRLKYNQTEGVLLDRSVGPVSHWKWHDLNDPPVLQQVMVDTQVAHKDPRIYNIHTGSGESNRTRPAKHDEDMLAIEFNNFIKEKSMKLTQNFQPYQIKMKALKLNENFSLKILDQASVYLIFRDGSSNMKVNIGMVLDHKEIVDTDTADVGDVSNSMQRFPARTDSLAVLQQAVAQAQRSEHLRVRHERRLHKPTGSLASVDRLTAAASRPLRPPLMTHSKASLSGPTCKCTTRKPTLNNVYYDNRISS
ncbi:uncharacterized protein isoform X2 [Choristoneura fumiferana]